jgi:hypothetical protein
MKLGKNVTRNEKWVWWSVNGAEIGVSREWARLGDVGEFAAVDVEAFLANWDCQWKAEGTPLIWERDAGKCRALCIEEGPEAGGLVAILEEAWRIFKRPGVELYVPATPWRGIVKAVKKSKVVGFTRIIPWPLWKGWERFVTRPGA